MIRARPGSETGLLLGEGGDDLWIVSARDVDWSEPQAPQVSAAAVQGFKHADLWTRMAASNPENIEVTGYPVDDGSWVLVFAWKVGTRPVHSLPRVDLLRTPAGVTLHVAD